MCALSIYVDSFDECQMREAVCFRKRGMRSKVEAEIPQRGDRM